MTTYGRNAGFAGIKSKIYELDMLINSFEYSKETDMLVQLKKLREQLLETLDNLEKTLGNSDKSLDEATAELANKLKQKNEKSEKQAKSDNHARNRPRRSRKSIGVNREDQSAN